MTLWPRRDAPQIHKTVHPPADPTTRLSWLVSDRLINYHALVKACFSLHLCMRSNFLHSISLDFSSQKISLKRFCTAPPPPLSAWWNFPFQINQFCQHRNMLSPFRKRERIFPLTPVLLPSLCCPLQQGFLLTLSPISVLPFQIGFCLYLEVSIFNINYNHIAKSSHQFSSLILFDLTWPYLTPSSLRVFLPFASRTSHALDFLHLV